MRKFTRALAAALVVTLMLTGCGSAEGTDAGKSGGKEIQIAYQYGTAYAPAVVAKEKGLIEAAYEEATGEKLTITWTQMSSGPDINTGFSSGELDVGFMGIAPAVTGITKKVGYKIFANISGQNHGMMTNDDSINGIGDLIGTSKQIALVNNGSFQHIILAKALSDSGYDAHALDSNIVAMKHPDGMTSLLSGNVACHLTTSPYLEKERAEDGLHEITEVTDAWTKDDSFVLGVASEALYNDEPEVYKAVCDGIEDAISYINDSTEEAASLTYEFDGNTEEEEAEFLKEGVYTSETSGVLELAGFMYEQSFIEVEVSDYSELAFDNVTGD